MGELGSRRVKMRDLKWSGGALIFLLSVLISCSNNPEHGVPSEAREKDNPEDTRSTEVMAQYRGYVAINQKVQDTFFMKNTGSSLGSYVDPNPDFGRLSPLLQLLGTYEGGSYGSEFKNGEPNSLNVLLWYLIFQGFSQDIGAYCVGSGTAMLQPEMANLIDSLCAWPEVTDVEVVLTDYWVRVMGFEAPLEEMARWQEFLMSEEAQKWSPSEAVGKMTFAIVFNPYFLLRH
jgi:hypothetical protein